MNGYAIDTHTAIEKLKAVGFAAQQAEAVTSLFTGPGSSLATKEDLKIMASELRVEIGGVRSELKEEIARLEGGIAGLRSEVKEEIAGLEAGQAVLKEQVSSLRIEIRFVVLFMSLLVVPMFLRSFGVI